MQNFTVPFLRPLKKFLPLKSYFIQHHRILILGIANLLLTDFLQLLIPLIIKNAIDILTVKTVTISDLLKQSGMILGIAVSIVFFRYTWRVLIFGFSRKVDEDLRNRLFDHLQKLSMSFYFRMKTGDIMARSINDINAVRMATGMGLVALIDGVVLGIAAIGFMLSINVKLTLFSLIPAPLVIISSRFLTRKMSTGFDRVQSSFSDLTERIRESFAGTRVIKAFDRENWEYHRVKTQGERYISVNMSLTKTLALFFPMMAMFTNLGLAVVLWLGGGLTIKGQITIGEFVAFTAYLNLLTWPMMAMGWVANMIQRGSASMSRINRIFEEAPEIKDSPTVIAVDSIEGRIEFNGLSISYPGQKIEAVRDMTFTIKQGETVAIVGSVGSGKTTLLQALPRLLKIPCGKVFIDGNDICDISLTTLRKAIGFVPQDPFVFSDTIRNNILFGTDTLTDPELDEVLHAAAVYDEIYALENGLDTVLGERGITLSGGQRQRLTIARALIINPTILILDDSLSMVDTQTETHILKQIMAARNNRTTLIVSHRISTIAHANKIIVMDQGTLVEAGTHAFLMAADGIYRKLYKKQQVVNNFTSEEN